ncbi:hypothetical protein ACH5RR_029130 [Cinchona calisaya]|uniref:Uncharacterized protein n=1 Tax=Cinchona calisaya TaxID=153742 RepID=A0ABD2YQR9_9GENT
MGAKKDLQTKNPLMGVDCPSSLGVSVAKKLLDISNSQPQTEVGDGESSCLINNPQPKTPIANPKKTSLDGSPKPNYGKRIFENTKFKAKEDGLQLAKKDHVGVAKKLLDISNSQPQTEVVEIFNDEEVVPTSSFLAVTDINKLQKATLFFTARFVGNPIKLDPSTEKGSCLGASKIYVELDLTKSEQVGDGESSCWINNPQPKTPIANPKKTSFDGSPIPNYRKRIFQNSKFKAKEDGLQLAKEDHVGVAEKLLDISNSQPQIEVVEIFNDEEVVPTSSFLAVTDRNMVTNSLPIQPLFSFLEVKDNATL